MHYKKFKVQELCDEVVRVTGFQARERKVNLIVDIAPDIPSEIVSDMKRIKLIIMNLLSNAIKFTQKGHVKLKISYLEKSSGLIEIAVEDTGQGINEENLKRLKKLLSKVDLSEKVSS